MPGTVVKGMVATEGVLPDEKVVDMDPSIKMLDPDTDQFTTMLDDWAPSRPPARR